MDCQTNRSIKLKFKLLDLFFENNEIYNECLFSNVNTIQIVLISKHLIKQ
ncbi:protein of unknown function [Vibrio tapetis subsp. tapetis]|uniref:Uncharacterized protein n=1 Tax=Vibrio tapetis subsp. tapetis TaxID=1671868 RepID=A0A2N8ZI05_9VIBR|nr:protein of unknown function [Vibrio tapetis subsp. tapetis]